MVLVLGSTNIDLAVRTLRLPRPGETVIGGEFLRANGGKGANQAVAAARAGASVRFLSAVGNDEFGNAALIALRKDGIDIAAVTRVDAPTGVALITVDDQGENCIVVAPGANHHVTAERVETAAGAFLNVSVCVAQLEVPLEAVQRAASLARQNGARFILNPAPARDLPDELLALVDIITPNATETEILTGRRPVDVDAAAACGKRLLERGVGTAVITLGERGAVVVTPERHAHVEAPKVQAVDTTAAGDTFNGALACALAEGRALDDAVAFAVTAGALAVTLPGAQPSIPNRAAIEGAL